MIFSVKYNTPKIPCVLSVILCRCNQFLKQLSIIRIFCPGKWAQISRDPVCFEGKGKKPGEFSPLFQTSSKMLKLVHQSGTIRCANDKKYDSKWGCWGHPILKNDGLDVLITDDNNRILLPTKFDFPNGKWYKLNGYNSKSKSLVFTSKASLNLGGQLKVWYGEDLVDYTPEDNHGRVCAQVFASGA